MKNAGEQKIEHIINRMLADRAEDAPANAVKYAKDLFRARAAEPNASFVKRILGVLQIDLAPNRAAFGERSAAGGQARQMLFEAGEHGIDLRITAVDDKLEIKGQVLGSELDAGEAEISDGKTLLKAAIGRSGRFEFAGLAASRYSLRITGPEVQIVLEKIDL